VSMESEADINTAFARFKELADRKSEIFDEDILALVSDESVTHEKEQYGFVSLSQHSETGERPHASIVFTVDGKEVKGNSDGNGPGRRLPQGHRDTRQKRRGDGALFGQRHQRLDREPGGSHGALQNSGRVVNGVGADPDIVVASAKAYLSALNKLQSKADRVAAQG
jgi:2-isopropylmalate synthase